MDDWRQYTSTLPSSLTLEEANLERSAEELIAKLESFGGSGATHDRKDTFTREGGSSPTSERPAVPQRFIPPPTARRPAAAPPAAAPNRRASIGSDADSEGYGQTSQASDGSSSSSRSISVNFIELLI